MSQTTIKIIEIFGGGVVLFYAIGFNVVKTFGIALPRVLKELNIELVSE